jgi:hypothetical protein
LSFIMLKDIDFLENYQYDIERMTFIPPTSYLYHPQRGVIQKLYNYLFWLKMQTVMSINYGAVVLVRDFYMD